MKYFLDTSSLYEIKKWLKYDVVDGITTNPSLISKEKSDPIKLIKEICKIVRGPVSVQVTSINSDEMIRQAHKFKKISKQVVIKLPANKQGYVAAKYLKSKNFKINITVGFNPTQLIPFAKLNVDYFSLILGKTEDWGFSNKKSITQSKKILADMNVKTKLLLASIRNEDHLIDAIEGEAEIVTIPPSTWEKIFENKYTKLALEGMSKDWKQISKNFRKKYE